MPCGDPTEEEMGESIWLWGKSESIQMKAHTKTM